ncbi:ROK family protein [Ferruginibacter paludis]|uniref:ROK family protein n=1 Tax=Ferruginibacter paludis TaxID=1310417 RepID=UPI0025B47D91|nr:ROK family protein [Ferruginibacter paludis]MDN3656889.1 ROK family protein [Ferruginibacter paludis]
MNDKKIIGVDFGATSIKAGLVHGDQLSAIHSKHINNAGTEADVLQDLFFVIDQLIDKEVVSIGVGVPSVVDTEEGIVYDVINIPSWKEVPLKKMLEERYHIPAFINNDANCFALGEHYFGKGIGKKDMIGLTIGTGLGAGIIINNRLFAGANCGAGEFGMVQYLDHVYEYYACGQFFNNVYHTDGPLVFEKAKAGDQQAQQWYAEMGTHLGNAIKTMMYTYDISLIIFGGSVRLAYPYFQETMWTQIKTFAFTKSAERLRIEISEMENPAIFGAAGLYYDQVQ